MTRPVVIIGINGGVADYQALPPGSVDIVLIDWDNLDVGEHADYIVDDINVLIAKVRTLQRTFKEDAPKGYLASILKNLRGCKKSVEALIEDQGDSDG